MDRPTFTNVCEATSQSHELDNYKPIHRKGKKLLAEKKRRARINNCLLQIRDLVCEGEEDKDSDIDKMEKAEILEKTLEVLTRVRRDYSSMNLSTSSSSPGNTSALHPTPSTRHVMAVRYASGFSSCAEESIRYIQSSRLVPAEVKAQLQNHLRSIARRMESGVAEVEGLSVAPQSATAFIPQYPGHLYSGTPSSMMHRTIPAVGDSVSSSVPCEAETLRGFRIPSPIHSSTPVTSHPAASTVTPVSLPSSRRYECITPEIDVVEAGDGSSSVSESSSASHQHRLAQQKHSTSADNQASQQRLPSTPEFSAAHHASTSPAFPATSTPSRSCPQIVRPTPSNFSPYPQPPHSSVPTPTVLPHLHPSTCASSPLPSSACPSTPQTIYAYHGYEPYPTTTPTFMASSPRFHPYASPAIPATPATTRCRRNSTPRSAASTKSQVATPSPALDLCVKRSGTHQISPETMWRPW